MDADFWHERWLSNRIGFHLGDTHPLLRRYHLELTASTDHSPVLVPLCGKSLDLLFLARLQLAPIGVELSSTAARAFFEENKVELTIEGPSYRSATSDLPIEIVAGDYFEWPPPPQPFRYVYDRAALIALPPDLRTRYVSRTSELCGPVARWLLITLDYDQSRMAGPPFSVPPEEVAALVEPHGWTVRMLERKDITKHEPNFMERGLDRLFEAAYILTRTG